MRLSLLWITVLGSVLSFAPSLLGAQLLDFNAPPLRIAPIYAPMSLPYADMVSATTLQDLDRHFHPEWIRTYLSVKLTTTEQGSTVCTLGKSDVLTEDQQAQLRAADEGSVIRVDIEYIPENTLEDNPARSHSFSVRARPAEDAIYVSGEQSLTDYFLRNIIEQLPAGTLQPDELVAVTFVVSEIGEVANAEVYATSESAELDALLLKSVQQMPPWKPARHHKGTKTAQAFSVLLGNQESCLINLVGVD